VRELSRETAGGAKKGLGKPHLTQSGLRGVIHLKVRETLVFQMLGKGIIVAFEPHSEH
jgi:hypothetical protein